LDEVDAALDEANIGFRGWFMSFPVHAVYRDLPFEEDNTGGHNLRRHDGGIGVSKRVSVRFEDVSEDGHISPAALFEHM
jgi:hypothetical protein